MAEKTSSIAILLCTYDSRKFLTEQLNSFDRQSHINWSLYISDDNSQDNTLDIIDNYKNKRPQRKISVQQGPQKGFSLNFLSLVNDTAIHSDYYAYSDHDDIWWNDKLERAVDWLDTIPSSIPALYCSRTCLVDDGLNNIGLSPLFSHPPSFANAIVQNIAGGNTMVFNNAARHLLQKINNEKGVVSHDWLTYQVVTSCGGEVFYDSHPTLNYRQHNENLIGANNHWKARLSRMKMLYLGVFREWNARNIFILESIKTDVSLDSHDILDQVRMIRDDSFLIRVKAILHLNIYRQTWLGNVGLIAAIIFKRF